MSTVRTRFAPSPTGFLHVGNVRAALFPWLVARQAGGTFILRIEDTDRAREVSGAVQYIHDTFEWLGIDWDEGPDKPGEFAPYIQSERKENYEQWARKLIAAGRAYSDVRTPEELDAIRADAASKHKAFLAREYRPDNPPDWQPGTPLRFLSEPKPYTWHDEIMGDLSAGPEAVDDFIILKSDGFPTYNFAHIVDDHDMQITHVIRGLEYIASMPKYLNLYDALGIAWPVFAHMPHVMAPDGNKKLSKRDGARSILDYKQQGYLPEAVLNFLASLGWNDGSEKEIFSHDELIQKFSLNRVQRSGARFDEKRLEWMDGAWIRSLDNTTTYTRCQDFWPDAAKTYDEAYKRQVLGLVQERLKYFSELPELTSFFFTDLPVDITLVDNNKQLQKFSHEELKALLTEVRDALKNCSFEGEPLQDCLNDLLEKTNQKPGVLFSLIRIATTQAPFSPGLAETMAVIGKERSLKRIDAQLAALTNAV